MLLFSRQNKKVNNKLNSPLKSYLEEWLTLIALFLFNSQNMAVRVNKQNVWYATLFCGLDCNKFRTRCTVSARTTVNDKS